MGKTCKQCGVQFEIQEADLKFYKRISPKFGNETLDMPPPNLCFGCRHQKRLAFRNEMNLYHRKCDRSLKQIISMYSPDKSLKIYAPSIWWSDNWDPLAYGKDFDFNRPFFEQYKELQKEVPRMALNNISAENSDYCNLALGNKNCYLVFTADYNEACAYLRFSDKNYRCFDSDFTYESTDCYECMDVGKCMDCYFCHKCLNSDGLFLCYNMIGCHDCIASANLRNKRYFIFNKEYKKEEYEREKKEMELGTYSNYMRLKREYLDFLKTQPRKYLDIVNCEESLGDYLRDCKNAYQSYVCIGLEDCKYMMHCYYSKDCYDWDFVGAKGSELCHEMASCAYNMVNCHFCSGCWENDSDLYYCELCLGTRNCFGCISLRHKEYCILNKQYSRAEYEELVPRIIRHMQKFSSGRQAGEWGEFFPMDLSAYAYNETVAYEYFPLNKEEVVKKGFKWHDEDDSGEFKGEKSELPDNVKDAGKNVCEKVLVCEETGKPFKIIPQELTFCKIKNLPLPRIAFRQRHRKRMALRNPFLLWERECSKCGAGIHTTYAPDRLEPVYCEECYKKEVY